MKSNKLVKFSLTLVCSAVLAACSSSGGSSNNSAAEQKAKQEAAAKVAAEQAAAAEKAAAEKAAAEAEALVKGTQTVGHKFVKKTDSNLNVGLGNVQDSNSSEKVTSMTLDLEPSLDTIVVAIPVKSDGTIDKDGRQIYLEDFDFRGNTENTSGTHTLDHIYKTTNGATDSATARGVETISKTSSMGNEQGKAYVYENGRLNYTHKQQGKDVLDERVARTDGSKYSNEVNELKDSVAEVYGYRTFAIGDSKTGNKEKGDYVDAAVANAPFGAYNAENKEYTDGVKLNYVQYGRVTSKLDGVDANSLKDGKDLGQYKTRVASFGGFAEKGTEDHYFYRGVNDTKYSATLAADLAKTYFGKDTAEGTLKYQGHAVTYNLDHNYNGLDNVPNAIGYQQQLVSGTHVAANIDLASKAVTGNLYNVWRSAQTAELTAEHNATDVVAKFQGTLSNNGSINGTSTKFDGTAGTLEANLFGANAQELGGTLASNDHTAANSWGASFGAKLQNTAYVAPVTPETVVTVKPGLGESTDNNNTNTPLNK